MMDHHAIGSHFDALIRLAMVPQAAPPEERFNAIRNANDAIVDRLCRLGMLRRSACATINGRHAVERAEITFSEIAVFLQNFGDRRADDLAGPSPWVLLEFVGRAVEVELQIAEPGRWPDECCPPEWLELSAVCAAWPILSEDRLLSADLRSNAVATIECRRQKLADTLPDGVGSAVVGAYTAVVELIAEHAPSLTAESLYSEPLAVWICARLVVEEIRAVIDSEANSRPDRSWAVLRHREQFLDVLGHASALQDEAWARLNIQKLVAASDAVAGRESECNAVVFVRKDDWTLWVSLGLFGTWPWRCDMSWTGESRHRESSGLLELWGALLDMSPDNIYDGLAAMERS